MRLTFNRSAFAALLAVTVVEVLIATLGKPYPLLRGFVGDVLAVGWAYLVYRSFIRAGVLPLAVAALLTGYAVEFGQYRRGCSVGAWNSRCCASCWAACRTGGTCWPTRWGSSWCCCWPGRGVGGARAVNRSAPRPPGPRPSGLAGRAQGAPDGSRPS